RKDVKTPGKVYTNESLGPDRGSSAPPASAPAASSSTTDKSAASADKSTADKAAADKTGDKAAADKGDVKDQTYWTKRMTDARNALERSQSFAEALQVRINSLTTDFTNRDDPAQRSQI